MAEFVVKFVVMNGGDFLVKVTISGAPGSGTSTLVSKIVESTGWSSLNGGEVFRNEAKRRNMSVHEFSELCKSNLDVDRSLDSLLKEAMIRVNGPDIIESRLSGWWAHELEIGCHRIWIHTSDEERAHRIQKREGGDFSDRLNQSKRRQDADKERYMVLYNINLDNMSPYTFVVDADQLSAEEVFSIVIKHLEE
jgi:cytidylate kinase